MCACLIRRPGKAADRTCRRKEPELQEGGSRNFHKEPDYITGGIPYYMQFPSPLRNTIHFFIVSTCSYYSQRKFCLNVSRRVHVCLSSGFGEEDKERNVCVGERKIDKYQKRRVCRICGEGGKVGG